MWRHRELLWQFTLRNIHARHKGTILGMAWVVINPLLMLVLYTFVFGIIFGATYGVREDESSFTYAIGLFLSLTLFQLFAETLSAAPMVITSQPNFAKKVVFPLEILPTAYVGAALFHFAASMILVLLGIVFVNHTLTWGILWLPVIIVPLVLLSLGTAWLVAALGVFLRDLASFMQFLSMAFLYASAIFYPSSKVIEHEPMIWNIIKWNPLIHIVDEARNVVLWDMSLNPRRLIYAYVCSMVVCLVGFAVFTRLKRSFADVL